MTRVALIDGKPGGAISALDRGVQFGDGVFETMAVIGGRIRLIERHLARLEAAAAHLAIALAPSLRDEITATAQALGHGVLKLVVTRGVSGRGYAPPKHPRPTRIVYTSGWPELPASVKLTVCHTRLASGGTLAGIKHLNRLEQVLGRLELAARPVDDAIMLDAQDNVIETTSANLFIVGKAGLVTPALERCGVAGVMRDHIISMARADGMSVTECDLRLDAVHDAREVFCTNAIAGVTPVVALDQTRYAPGPITQAFARRLTQP